MPKQSETIRRRAQVKELGREKKLLTKSEIKKVRGGEGINVITNVTTDLNGVSNAVIPMTDVKKH